MGRRRRPLSVIVTLDGDAARIASSRMGHTGVPRGYEAL